MRLRRLTLDGIGPFAGATLDFGEATEEAELVLFEGPNGSGKTTVAATIARLLGPVSLESGYQEASLTDSPYQDFVARFPEPRTLVHYEGVFEHGGVSAHVSGRYGNPWLDRPGSGPVEVLLREFNEADDEVSWAAFLYHASMPTARLTTNGPAEIPDDPRAGALAFQKSWRAAEFLGQLAINLELERIQYAQYALERGDETGRLHRAAESRRSAITQMEGAFSELLGRTVRIAFEPGQMAPRMSFDGREIPLEQLGEGIRNAVAWLADLLVRLFRIRWHDTLRSPFEQEFWLILDEIEASLHPTAQLRVLPALRTLFPRAHIYATTHSPFVVASAAHGSVFRLRPDPSTGQVSGTFSAVPLTPGTSLEWVVEEIFAAPTGIVDPTTRRTIEAHRSDVKRLRAGETIDWSALASRRQGLMALGHEVSTLILLIEAPVRPEIERGIRDRAA